MKRTFNYLLGAMAVLAAFASCKKDENRVTLENSTPPVLTASPTTALTLQRAAESNTALRFTWTNPEYRFTTGVNSQDVSYTLEVDTTGANFGNPRKQEISVARDLSKDFTVKDLNTVLTKLNLVENTPHPVEFRLKASLSGGTVPLYSNVIKMTITPYLDAVVDPPASGKLYITGSATLGDWMKDNAPELTSQKFTRLSTTLFEITVPLTANNSFLFVPVYGDWSDKYGYTGAGNANNVTGDSFKRGGNDIKAPASSGTYKITVDFKLGTYTAVKQ